MKVLVTEPHVDILPIIAAWLDLVFRVEQSLLVECGYYKGADHAES